LTPLVAILLGVVEGLTEYLPVSSTGHLILVGRALGLEGEGAKSFEIVIQLGAILAVLLHYRRLLWERVRGLVRRQPEALRLASALAVAFALTSVAGLLLRKPIKKFLFGPLPVAAALIAGGLVMIVVESVRKERKLTGEEGLDKVGWRRGLAIGVGQCFSLWPGASRSMCTIVAGQLSGLSTSTAAEFSFLLALPTLGAACLYEAYQARHTLRGQVSTIDLVLGLLVSFLVAWAVIAAFLRYLKARGLAPFGYYRIALGLLVLFLLR
jgi:undecaprenyl-diphosphatase